MSIAPGPEPSGNAIVTALRTSVAEMLYGATVEVSSDITPPSTDAAVMSATGEGADGAPLAVTVRLGEGAARLVRSGRGTALAELHRTLPAAGLRALQRLAAVAAPTGGDPPALGRVVRDILAAEVMTAYLSSRLRVEPPRDLVADTLEYLIELSGTRVEAHELTHGVVITDVLTDEPRLHLRYPAGLRPAKRAPLLFDGRRSVLLVDASGLARTELQRHRLDRLRPTAKRPASEMSSEAGYLVAEATRILGGVGFYVRTDRSIWTFVDGQPLLVRRGEHWTGFPIELSVAIAETVRGGAAADLVTRAAFIVSTQPYGAILAIVDGPSGLDGVVAEKDRYDLRSEIDEAEMRPETWLHHLLDAVELDEQTLARLATLDGATVVDVDGRLLAYGAIVATPGTSQYEGARTAAARALSERAKVVLKVSVDGDITLFERGQVVTTFLGAGATSP